MYKLTCRTCSSSYIGQTGRRLITRFGEHQRYMKKKNLKSTYALHILHNRQEYGSIHNTVELLKTCKKGKRNSCWEPFYIQTFQRQGLLIQEQHTPDLNPLYTFVQERIDTLPMTCMRKVSKHKGTTTRLATTRGTPSKRGESTYYVFAYID
jgi:hypothetical protein